VLLKRSAFQRSVAQAVTASCIGNGRISKQELQSIVNLDTSNRVSDSCTTSGCEARKNEHISGRIAVDDLPPNHLDR